METDESTSNFSETSDMVSNFQETYQSDEAILENNHFDEVAQEVDKSTEETQEASASEESGIEYYSVFGLTRSPYLNELIRVAETFYNEPHHPEIHIAELSEKLNLMKEVSKNLSNTFERIQQLQEDIPTIREQNIIVAENLNKLKEALEKFDDVISTKDKHTLVQYLLQIKSAVLNLFSAFDILRDEEQNLERYSESPYFNELIRIAKGVMRGAFPPEALKEIIMIIQFYWEKAYKDFNIYKTQKIDILDVKNKIPELENAYEECGRGLQEINLFFEDGNFEHIEEGIALVKQASDIMIESLNIINKALSLGAMKTCLRCGAENPINAKCCTQCQAVFPNYTQDVIASEIDFRFDNEITPVSQRMITLHVQKLIDIIESFKRDRGNLEELDATINWLWEKIDNAKKHIDFIKIPDQMGDEEDRNLLKLSHDLLLIGIDNLEKALWEMKLFPEDGDISHLTSGLDLALAGNDNIYEVQKISQQIWEKYNPKTE